MKQSVVTGLLVGASITALAFFAAPAAPRAAAQVGEASSIPRVEADTERARLLAYKPDPVKYPVPRTKFDGKPDLSGSYHSTVHFGDSREQARNALIALYRPEAQVRRAVLDPEESSSMHCWPGSPALGGTEITVHIHIVHSPGFVAVIDPYTTSARIIPTDGRPHDPSREPAFAGNSVAHWEGDTLVVDTRNYKERYLSRVDFNDTWSDALHVVERWSRPDANILEWEATLEDPKMLTGPWKAPRWRRARVRGADISLETHCVLDEVQQKLNQEQREALRLGRRRDSLLK